MTKTEHEKLLQGEMEQSELTRDHPLTAEQAERRGRAAVYSLRLPADAVERLEALARQRDVPPSVLARGYVLAGIESDENPDSVQTLVTRMTTDMAELKKVMGI